MIPVSKPSQNGEKTQVRDSQFKTPYEDDAGRLQPIVFSAMRVLICGSSRAEHSQVLLGT